MGARWRSNLMTICDESAALRNREDSELSSAFYTDSREREVDARVRRWFLLAIIIGHKYRRAV